MARWGRGTAAAGTERRPGWGLWSEEEGFAGIGPCPCGGQVGRSGNDAGRAMCKERVGAGEDRHKRLNIHISIVVLLEDYADSDEARARCWRRTLAVVCAAVGALRWKLRGTSITNW